MGPSKDRQYEHICQVTEVVEGRKLTYSWRYEGYAYVTYELKPEGDKTRVSLTYRITRPFPVDNPDFKLEMAAYGWNLTLNNLKKFIEA